MGTMRRGSLVWRLLIVLGGAFAVAALVVLLLVNSTVQRVVRRSGLEVYEQRVEAIVRELDRQVTRLELLGQKGIYRANVQESTLQHLVEVQYREAEPKTFPFIVDSDGIVQMHPWHPRGSRTNHDRFVSMPKDGLDVGSFVFDGPDGERRVVVTRYHPAWDWFVAYEVPEHLLVEDAGRIEQRLILVWVVVALTVLILAALVVLRETRPLLSLANAAAAMAKGDLDAEIDRHGRGEIGVLARGFIQMRDAIRQQFDDLRESESRYRQVFDAMADGLVILDLDGGIVAANPRVTEIYGWSSAQLIGRPITSLLRENDHELAQTLRTPPADEPATLHGLTCDHEGQELETDIAAVRLSFQGRSHALVILRDVTGRHHLERQLVQSQKLESVGRLASGIAHDFNNLLTPVLGYTEMLLDNDSLGEDDRDDLEAIRLAGERARELAHQLLAFSRRQVLEMQDLDLGATLATVEPILRRTLREDITLALDVRDQGFRVRADISQIEQVVMNLAINAMDAMPDGGRIEIVTDCFELDHSDADRDATLLPGHYSRLVVRDNGHGVPPEIVDRVFEPFFSTKGEGMGTGLGLPTVRSIVSQHGGSVRLSNQETGGCEVEVLFPCLPASAPDDQMLESETPSAGDGHGETVLVVEDDAMVREFASAFLVRHGYVVRVYTGAQTCLDDMANHDHPGDLLLTDIVMPGMSGPDLRDALHDAGHGMPVLFMSGYAGETLVRHGLADGHADFIVKPLAQDPLLRKLRVILDAVAAG